MDSRNVDAAPPDYELSERVLTFAAGGGADV